MDFFMEYQRKFKMKSFNNNYFCVNISAILLLFLKCMPCVEVEIENTTTASSAENTTVFPILLPNYKREGKVAFMALDENAIDWENSFKKCGNPLEACPIQSDEDPEEPHPDSETDESIVEQNSTRRKRRDQPEPDDFINRPTLCRCDEDCLKYGDCCKTILTRLRKLPEDSYYRCVKLLDSALHSVRMISKCPSTYPNEMYRQLCENPNCPNDGLNPKHDSLCPLFDVPVLNNKTGELYRSIFCARCHSVPNHHIHPIKREINCTNLSSRKEWEEFTERAVYKPGELRWLDPTNSSVSCKLHIKELQPKVIRGLVPDIRFCGRIGREECPLDLTTEENQITSNLCFSYTQIVNIQTGEFFKNPHCAKCHYPDIDFKRGAKCLRTRDRGSEFSPSPGTRIFSSEPVGINILFHFSLDMDDGFVGYSSKCDGDEILDFIRHKCVPVICPKGYTLNDGQCEKNLIEEDSNMNNASLSPREETGLNDNETSPLHLDHNPSNNSEMYNSSDPCFLIILHPGEYRKLANGSLIVNKSTDPSGVILFQPGQYEKFNESSMSICAEDVGNTFESSFGPDLSYISSILLALSVLCSLVHVALYLILSKMRNLPGNNLLCLTVCLLISQSIFLTLIKTSNRTVCVIAAITMHYLFLASFCWMNIMSFDIWRTFSSEFLVRRYSGDSLKTFVKYSLFAWILPLLIVVLAIVTEFSLPDSVLVDPDFGPLFRKLRPLYGHNNLCWIGQKLSLFVFFALPVALIILCNLVLFTMTASTIWLQDREGNKFINGGGENKSRDLAKAKPTRSNGQAVGVNKGNNKTPLHGCNSGSTKTSDKIRFKLYAKLALIMGLTWILGFLSGFAQWLWYPFVIFNGLQGTFIFVAFDCKAKVWSMVRDKCGWKRKKRGRSGTGEEGSSELKRRGTATLSSTLRSSSTRTSTISRSSCKAEPTVTSKEVDLPSKC